MLTVALSVAAAALATVSPAAGPPVSSVFSIASIKAFPFYHDTGKFGSADLFDPHLVLRNVIIGGGDVEGATSATLLLIEVKTPKSDPEVKATLSVVARTDSGKLLDQEIALSEFSYPTLSPKLPFLVYGTGCEKLTVSVRVLLEGRGLAEETKTLPFRCAE